MKGLILKDLYMMRKYCKAYLLIAAVFISVSFASNDNLFFVFYPLTAPAATPFIIYFWQLK